jgi:hypothetical protein
VLFGTGLAIDVAITASNAAVPDVGASTSWESFQTTDPNAGEARLVDANLPSISGDGSVVTFEATPAVIEGNPQQTIYVRDRSSASNVATDILANLPGVDPDFSTAPIISRDGCHVAFATNRPIDLALEKQPGNGIEDDNVDIYRFTLPKCGGPTFELASVGLDEGGAATSFGVLGATVNPPNPFTEATDRPAISADGRWVVFEARGIPAAGTANRPRCSSPTCRSPIPSRGPRRWCGSGIGTSARRSPPTTSTASARTSRSSATMGGSSPTPATPTRATFRTATPGHWPPIRRPVSQSGASASGSTTGW